MRFYRCFIGVVVVVALTTVSCKNETKKSDEPRKVKCESATVVGDSSEKVILPGKVVAATDVNLGFRVAGIVDEICVTNGSFVRKGEVLARLDNRDYATQLSATQAEYDAVKSEVDRIVALYAEQSVSENDYDKATNGLRAITAKLEAHKNALGDTELRAPFDGYLQKSNFAKGEAVAAGTPVVAIISDSAPEIEVDIPVAYYLKQSRFDGATATFELFGDRVFNLKLKGITPKANLNQLYKATFQIVEADDLLPKAGMSAMMELRYSASEDQSVVIPFSAIVEREGRSSVWVVDEGRVTRREVVVSVIKSDGKAYVKSGISAGDLVVTAGVNSLKEGQEVSVLPRAAASNVGGLK